jgi:hypothetical protein|tara:strand:- start:124 stop:354 length:231 start_codon:yes stop_codon:yes gene_type:complete
MIDPGFDPYDTMIQLIETVNSQARLLEEVVRAHNKHERKMIALQDQNNFLRHEHEVDRKQIVTISKALTELINDTE